MRQQTALNWRTRNVLPPPRWTVGGRPSWSWELDIEPWAWRTGRLGGTTFISNEHRVERLRAQAADLIERGIATPTTLHEQIDLREEDRAALRAHCPILGTLELECNDAFRAAQEGRPFNPMDIGAASPHWTAAVDAYNAVLRLVLLHGKQARADEGSA